jgi:multidrug efflux system outer membrane protein
MSRDSAPRWLAAVLLVVGGLGGCTVGPNYKRPDVVVPAAWRHDPEQHASIANLGWWQLFEDPTLHELLAAAMVANRDVQVAVAGAGVPSPARGRARRPVPAAQCRRELREAMS